MGKSGPPTTKHHINWMLFVFIFFIFQVSFFSTSPELSNKNRFEYFSRTIPSDHYQVMAMVDIVKRMKWSYISIIYEESNYGIKVCIHTLDIMLLYIQIHVIIHIHRRFSTSVIQRKIHSYIIYILVIML